MRAVSVLIILLVSFPVLSEDSTTDERLARWLEQYPEADADKDGILTRKEAVAYRDSLRPAREKKPRLPPDFADISYGPHERQRFDIWLPDIPARDGLPFPVLVFFHGGGFVAGDKSSFDPSLFLEGGIACASVNYRFVDGVNTLSPVPFHDSARAIQTIRHRAPEWNLDGGRIALSGSSAGAVISMWLGYHEDLADPEADNPVERQSTRVTCLLPINGPTNLLPDWIVENIGGPRHVHGSFAKLFGEPVVFPLTDSLRKQAKEASPWEFVSEDDPPTLLIYTGASSGTPLPETVTTGESIHHAAFGKAMQARLEAFGVEVEFREQFDPRASSDTVEYLRDRLALTE